MVGGGFTKKTEGREKKRYTEVVPLGLKKTEGVDELGKGKRRNKTIVLGRRKKGSGGRHTGGNGGEEAEKRKRWTGRENPRTKGKKGDSLKKKGGSEGRKKLHQGPSEEKII